MKLKKIFKISVIIVTILLAMIIIYFIRNYMLINKFAKAYDEIMLSSNYSYVETQIPNNLDTIDTITEHYYKDGKSLRYVKNRTSGLSSITMYDKDKQQQTIVDLDDLKVTMNNSKEMIQSIEFVASLFSDKNKMETVFKYVITTEKIDGVECYALHYFGDLKIDRNSYYFDKKTGEILQYINAGGDKYRFTDWKTNDTTDNDITTDITGYEVFDYRV